MSLTHSAPWREINQDCRPQSLIQIPSTHTHTHTHTHTRFVSRLTERNGTALLLHGSARCCRRWFERVCDCMCVCVCVYVCAVQVFTGLRPQCAGFLAVIDGFSSTGCLSARCCNRECRSAVTERERDRQREKERLSTGTLQKKRAKQWEPITKLSLPVYEMEDGKRFIALYRWTGDVVQIWCPFSTC